MESVVRHIIFLVLLFFQNAHAGPNLSDFFENPKLVGEGTISFLFFDWHRCKKKSSLVMGGKVLDFVYFTCCAVNGQCATIQPKVMETMGNVAMLLSFNYR